MKSGANTYSVNVTLRDHGIDINQQLYAGPTNFIVRNEGTVEHNFMIDRDGIEKKFASDLKPGETRILQMELKPGAYQVYCPVGKHAEKHGMKRELKVM